MTKATNRFSDVQFFEYFCRKHWGLALQKDQPKRFVRVIPSDVSVQQSCRFRDCLWEYLPQLSLQL